MRHASHCFRPARRRRFVLLAAVLLPVLAAAAAAQSAQPKAAAPAPLAGDVVFLGGERAAQLTMPATAFDHARHARQLPCADCHKAQGGEARPAPAFKTFADIREDTPSGRKNAYHDACASCHAERSVEGKRGPALGQCRACHTVADPAALPRGGVFKPAFSASLHEKHLLSGDFPAAPAQGLEPTAILADNSPERCRACHHAPRHAKDQPPRTDSCRACHVSGPGTGTLAPTDEGAPPSLRVAGHAACLSCHTRKAEAKKAHGPTDCSGCHDKARFLARPRLPADPSLLTMQRPTGVVLKDTAAPEALPLSALYPQGPRWPTSMPGVPFNHSAHEKALDCQSCHHTSVKQACIKCHTAYGDPKARNVTLAQAMHSVGARGSCVGCHQLLSTASPECAGCHTPRPLQDSGRNCAFCHRAPADAKGDSGLLIGLNVPSGAASRAQQDAPPAPGATGDAVSPALALGPAAPGQAAAAALRVQDRPVPDAAKAAGAPDVRKEEPPAPGAPQGAVSPPLNLGPQPAAPASGAAKAAAASDVRKDAPPTPGAPQEAVSPPLGLGPQPAAQADKAPRTPAPGPAVAGRAADAPAAPQNVPPGPGAPQDAVSPPLGLGPQPSKLPEKARLDSLSKEYRPVEFQHARHLEKLGDAIGRKAPALLGLHARNGVGCAACHHHGPALQPGQTPPRCVSCHPAAAPADAGPLPDGRPLLKAAYHQRCMDCHARMGNEKPRATDCQACHARREPGEAPVW